MKIRACYTHRSQEEGATWGSIRVTSRGREEIWSRRHFPQEEWMKQVSKPRIGCLNNFSRFWGTGHRPHPRILGMWTVAWNVRV